MAVLSKGQVTAIVKEALNKAGNLGDCFDQDSMPDAIRTRIVDYIVDKYSKSNANVILSEEKFREFCTVNDVIDWCVDNQY